ncbi:MAG: phasin family protein [Planctomycetes bacterium]|nr:phasin family protein [Planctomycetota bacterium]
MTTNRKGPSVKGGNRSDFVRKLALAGVGAAVLAREEVQRQFERLVEKGTEVDRDGRLDLHLDLGKRTESLLKNVKDLRRNVSQFRGDIENRLDKFVGKVRTSVRPITKTRKDGAGDAHAAPRAPRSASRPRRRPAPPAPRPEQGTTPLEG